MQHSSDGNPASPAILPTVCSQAIVVQFIVEVVTCNPHALAFRTAIAPLRNRSPWIAFACECIIVFVVVRLALAARTGRPVIVQATEEDNDDKNKDGHSGERRKSDRGSNQDRRCDACVEHEVRDAISTASSTCMSRISSNSVRRNHWQNGQVHLLRRLVRLGVLIHVIPPQSGATFGSAGPLSLNSSYALPVGR